MNKLMTFAQAMAILDLWRDGLACYTVATITEALIVTGDIE